MELAARPGRGTQSRRDLMDIAIDCFARYGYQATSIDRIAKAAGVTKGALYYHFKDKEELLFEAVKKRLGQFERRVAGDLALVTDAPTALRELARVCRDHATKSNHRRLMVTLMVEALDTNPRLAAEFRAMMQRFRTFLTDIVRRGQRDGEFRADIDALVAAEVYAGAIMGAEIQYYQDPKGFDLAATIDAFVEQYVSWLSSEAANGRVVSRRARRK
ncbi:MAG TPA: TetR/AcrR family transcriptional regulator [Candidatus Acidoferrales bacterium]|nr:TetR/AcrR family transcriptional regulator [Candidatus Acidoferrales bacterium]